MVAGLAIEQGLITQEEYNRDKSLRQEINALDNQLQSEERGANYTSSHFDEKNILAHTRLTDRIDSDGKKVLFVEEIQSDWHQAGRKSGYKADKIELPSGYTIVENASGNNKPQFMWQVFNENGEVAGFGPTKEAALADFDAVSGSGKNAVPDAPFKKTWHEYAFKRIVRMAAEGGYDRIAWTTGSQQNERFKLSKFIDRIQYSKSKRDPSK